MTTPTVLQPFRLKTFYASLRGIAILTPWILHLLATDILLSALLPLSYFFPTLVYNASSTLASLVWAGIQTIFTTLNHAPITTSGTRLPDHESAIVISNHISWTDFYLIQHLAQQSYMLSRCRWFAKAQLRHVPFLGWGLWAMGMPLITRNWTHDTAEMTRVFAGPSTHRWPIWLISYSEGTRYTSQKYLETVRWCKANGKPAPHYTLHPRTRGFVATIQALCKGSSVRAVYDLTIAYAKDDAFLVAPSMWTSLSEPRLDRAGWRFHVHAERFGIEIFEGMQEAEIAAWLEDRWQAKARVLEGLKKELDEGRGWGG